ncbi:hypothetical protein F5X99DRAFT_381126 [Biscogniauxia marginata]|nr:hypothetical protein F5X99DRAFT_381126 [Biscogniauxia marginata]
MYVLETSPEFQFFASSRCRLDGIESLGNGRFRLGLKRLPEIFKNMIRKYCEDELPANIHSFAEKKGFRVGRVTLGPDLVWIDRSSFPAFHPKSRCHVLLAVAPPVQTGDPATNASARTMLTIRSQKDESKNVDIEWHVGYVYMLEEGEVAQVSDGDFAFIGIQYATRPVS